MQNTIQLAGGASAFKAIGKPVPTHARGSVVLLIPSFPPPRGNVNASRGTSRTESATAFKRNPALPLWCTPSDQDNVSAQMGKPGEATGAFPAVSQIKLRWTVVASVGRAT